MKVSECCGAYHEMAEDYGICPDCKEHCEFVEEDEEFEEDIIEPQGIQEIYDASDN